MEMPTKKTANGLLIIERKFLSNDVISMRMLSAIESNVYRMQVMEIDNSGSKFKHG